jgi:tetratricopeptide (TPR) repeat protein
LLGVKQPELALEEANKLISLDPNNSLGYFGRGMVSRLTGKFQDAISNMDRAISLNPRESAAFAERGQAYVALAQLDKALVDFDQAIALNPSNDTARAARGLALLFKGNTSEGLVDIKNALDRNPANQTAELGQGLAMLVSGQYDRSIVALNQLIGKNIGIDSFARMLRARAYLAKKDPVSAMADLNQVLVTRPNDADALRLRGIVYSTTKDYERALDDLGRSNALRETIEGYVARAAIYEAQGNIGKAASDYRRATELKPLNVFETLAQAESKKKVDQLSKRVPCAKEGTCL